MRRKAHARKATASKKAKPKLKAKAKAKASPKKQTLSKMASNARKTLKPQPRSRAKVESTIESPREPSREIDSLTDQPKMRLSRKNSAEYREKQSTLSQPRNTVNPSGRR